MATFIGKGDLASYSLSLTLENPIRVTEIPRLLFLPQQFHENVIAVKENRVLSLDEEIFDQDCILLFLSLMGG